LLLCEFLYTYHFDTTCRKIYSLKKKNWKSYSYVNIFEPIVKWKYLMKKLSFLFFWFEIRPTAKPTRLFNVHLITSWLNYFTEHILLLMFHQKLCWSFNIHEHGINLSDINNIYFFWFSFSSNQRCCGN